MKIELNLLKANLKNPSGGEMALTHNETKAPDGNGEKPESTPPFLLSVGSLLTDIRFIFL
jgi:hypothetical protein